MFRRLFIILFLIVAINGVFHAHKKLPAGLDYQSADYVVPAESIHFFRDLTYTDSTGERHFDQQIFDEIMRMIADAERYILVDMFFYSDFLGAATSSYRQLSDELTTALVQKKIDSPNIVIQVITDPINTVYGGYEPEHLSRLRVAGIPVFITDLSALRDSNPIYSSVWRTFFAAFGNSSDEGYLPNILDSRKQKLGLRTYLATLNYKANHRKIILADYQSGEQIGFSTLVTSANPHDGSSAHSNIAIREDLGLWRDVLETESKVAEFSGGEFLWPAEDLLAAATQSQAAWAAALPPENSATTTLQVQLLTENAIERRIVAEIDAATTGAQIDLAMFYLSDRTVIEALKRADDRGAKIRLLLDPNKDAFGREKDGKPNRSVAHELLTNTPGNTTVRWCDTHGEQCHSKLVLIKTADRAVAIQGSANLTKRNLDNFNLETNLAITGHPEAAIFADLDYFFNANWQNEPEQNRYYSTDYQKYEDTSWWRNFSYRLAEFSGVSRW